MTRTYIILALMAALAFAGVVWACVATDQGSGMLILHVLVASVWVLTVVVPLLFIGGQTLMKARQKWGVRWLCSSSL